MNLSQLQPVECLLADLYGAMLEGRGWSLARVGDSEVLLMKCPTMKTDWKFYDTRITLASFPAVRERFVASYQVADWTGVFMNDASAAAGFELCGLGTPLQQVYAWVNVHLPMYRDFVDLVLRRERLLLMGGLMAELAEKCLAPIRSLSDVEILDTALAHPLTMEDFEALCGRIASYSGRIVLISMSIWAKPLCAYAKSLGKIGIDFGNAATFLLDGRIALNADGLRGRRGYLDHYRKIAPFFNALHPKDSLV
ncbi:MAG: hypothetical protein V1755_06725 [Chloroflexota bacterium]